ncbi:Zn-ribbon domain-containing OB-fold protein [Nonomuraea angiospora]|uniref:Zn-ribbon domain-containing OB-fold protein n=1 Tax=Nonomuraea angiospora TaxID=46172 RepID=UPI0029B9E32B|nr:zinc ribbon domain-containing protein [Nonomuraea angiospora]MDX3108352.1 zinc ribbon domain-containing protein [Nonomuraea angiospora]
MMTAYRPEPDRDSRQWWERVGRQEFAVQECDGCGAVRFPARALCPECRAEAWHWREVEPEGVVESWIVNHQPFMPGFGVPYVVVMVRLAAVPGCFVYGNWRGDGAPERGRRVRAAYRRVDERLTLVDWAPVEDDGNLDDLPVGRESSP